MTTINIHKSKFIIALINQMLHALSLLNKSDRALNQVAAKIKELMNKPEIDGNELTKLLMKSKVIVESYEIKPKGDKPKDDPLADLPLILYGIFEELENIIATQKVMDKISGKGKMARVQQKLEKYCSAIGVKKKLAATNTVEMPREKRDLTIQPESAKKMANWIKETIQQFVSNYNEKYRSNQPVIPPSSKKDIVLEYEAGENTCHIHLYSGLKFGRNTWSDALITVSFDNYEHLINPLIKIHDNKSLFGMDELLNIIADEVAEIVQLPTLSQEKSLWWKDDKTGKLIRPAYFGESKHNPPKISWSLVDAATYITKEKNTPRKIEAPK